MEAAVSQTTFNQKTEMAQIQLFADLPRILIDTLISTYDIDSMVLLSHTGLTLGCKKFSFINCSSMRNILMKINHLPGLAMR